MRINCKVMSGLLIAAFALTACGTELLNNGSFKKVLNDRPTGWTFHDWKGLSNLNVIKEDQSNVVILSSENADGKSTLGQLLTGLELKQGTTFKISGWYKTENIGLGDKGMLQVQCIYNRFASATGTANSKKYQKINLTSSPDKWEKFESILSVPVPVVDINLFILCYNFSGKLYLKDISLETIPQSNEINPSRKYVWREAEQIFKGAVNSNFGREEKNYYSGTGGTYGKPANFKWRFQIAPDIDPQSLLPVKRQYHVWLRLYGYLDCPEVEVLFKDKSIAAFKTVSNEIADAQGKYSAPGKYYWQKTGTFQSEGGPGSLTFNSAQQMLIDSILVTDDPAYEPIGFEAVQASDKSFFKDINTPNMITAVYSSNGVSDKIISPLEFMFHNDNNRQIKTGDKPAILRIAFPKSIQVAGATAHWGGVSWGNESRWGNKRLHWEKKGTKFLNSVECNIYEFYYYYLGLETILFIKADQNDFKHGNKYVCEYQLEFNDTKQPMENLVLEAVALNPAPAFKNIWIGFCGLTPAFYFDYPQLVDAALFSGINLFNSNLKSNYDLFKEFADKCLKNRIMLLGAHSPLLNIPLKEEEQMVTIEKTTKKGFPSLSIDKDSTAMKSTCSYMRSVSSDGFGLVLDDEHTNQLKDSADYNTVMKKLFGEYLKTTSLTYLDPVAIVKNKESYPQLYSAWVDFRCERMVNFYRLYHQAYLNGFSESNGKYTFGKTMFIPQIIKNKTVQESKVNSYWDYRELAKFCDYISPMIYTYHQGIEDSAEVGDILKMYNDYIGRKITVPTLLSGCVETGEIPLPQKPMIKYQIFESLMQQSRVIMFWAAPTPMDPLNLQFISDAIRQAGPYEEIILNGQPLKINGYPEWIRINALQLDKRILIYVTNYRNDALIKAKIRLPGKIINILDIESSNNVTIVDNSFEMDFHLSRGKLFLATIE